MLVLLAEQRGTPGEVVWFSPTRAQERFGLAPTTVTKGLREHKELGLLRSRRRVVSEQGTYIGFKRYRNAHTLTLVPTAGKAPAGLQVKSTAEPGFRPGGSASAERWCAGRRRLV